MPAPNILLVHTHDQGRYLGCYGRDVATPNIDALAAEGALFEDYYCTAPQCGPSRSSIMTGRHPHDNGLMGHNWLGWSVDDDIATLPGQLRAAGYDTAAFGIHHETATPDAFGYDRVSEDSDVADIVPDVQEYLADREEPFFASVGIGEPHRLGREHEMGFHAPAYDAPDPASVDVPPYLPDSEVVREELAGFQGMVSAVDRGVGRLLETLDAEGLAENTVVLFTTDHGIAMPRAKGMCYDPGIETALVARFPGVFEGGERYDELLSNVDLMPTLLDLVGVDVPDGVAGRSFRPLVDGEYTARERIFVEMTYHDKYNPVRGVRTDRYKYVRTFDDQPEVYLPLDILVGPSGREHLWEYYSDPRPEEELYDLHADPHEQDNVIDDPAHADAAAELRDTVEDWMARTDDPLLDGDVPTPEAHVEKLRTFPW
jgi:arylsulfatase A-like enzyme